jgi:hypothetical protein
MVVPVFVGGVATMSNLNDEVCGMSCCGASPVVEKWEHGTAIHYFCEEHAINSRSTHDQAYYRGIYSIINLKALKKIACGSTQKSCSSCSHQNYGAYICWYCGNKL